MERSLSQPGKWILYREFTLGRRRIVDWFNTPGEAIDYVHKNWPWWP